MSEEAARLVYLVVFKKKNVKSANKFFVVTSIRRDEFNSPAVFHGIGYWATEHPNNILDTRAKITEVWIPWEQIDHVESLMYRQRS